MTGTLFVISGPSGVGKGTLITRLLEARPSLWVSVSTTTRAPRPGETDGVDYYFTERETFEADVGQGQFLEWAQYADNMYGTSRIPVVDHLDRGESVILEIEVAGARQVREAMPDCVLIMIVPPSFAALELRLRHRATEGEPALARRLATAKVELAAQTEFDHVIANDEIPVASTKLLQLIDRNHH